MNISIQTPAPVTVIHPSFVRLFFALGVGVAVVTLVLCVAVNSPGLAMGFGGTLTLAGVVLVMHEVNRLLADDGGDDR